MQRLLSLASQHWVKNTYILKISRDMLNTLYSLNSEIRKRALITAFLRGLAYF